jgi:metal-dependent amidase/aminoacylase/carboxypeptidase family protein
MKIKFLVYLSLAIVVTYQQKANCQQKTKATLTHESIKLETDSIFNKLVDIRRDFHENPELAGKEIRTQKKIAQYLHDLGNELTKKIYNLLSRAKTGSKPWEIQNIVNPQIGLKNPNTIFKDYLIMDEKFTTYHKNGQLFLEAYLYETNASNLKNIIPTIEQLIEAGNYKSQLLSISFIQENPTVINDKKLTDIAVKTLDHIYGKEFIVTDYGQTPYFNDDFAYFQQKIPGVYFLLGGSNFEKGMIAMNHAPNFKVDEECIRTGVKSFSSLILERLKN